jgi:hypothetical protein
MNNEMILGLDKLSAKINADFVKFVSSALSQIDRDYDRQKDRIRKFNSELQFKVGKKYIKFTSGRSVWGFVMIEDDDKFLKGDILKPASFNTPARNFARGNILNGDFGRTQWTGA